MEHGLLLSLHSYSPVILGKGHQSGEQSGASDMLKAEESPRNYRFTFLAVHHPLQNLSGLTTSLSAGAFLSCRDNRL